MPVSNLCSLNPLPLSKASRRGKEFLIQSPGFISFLCDKPQFGSNMANCQYPLNHRIAADENKKKTP